MRLDLLLWYIRCGRDASTRKAEKTAMRLNLLLRAAHAGCRMSRDRGLQLIRKTLALTAAPSHN